MPKRKKIMARRKKNAPKEISLSTSFDLESLVEEAESEIKEKPRSAYGFLFQENGELEPMEQMAENLLGILETKDIPFATLEKVASKMVSPVVGETKEQRKAKVQAIHDTLFSRIRSGAAHVGKKVSAKEKPGFVGEILHMYIPTKRETKEKNETE